MVQRTALTKFNIFLLFMLHLIEKGLRHIIKNKKIIANEIPLPTNTIMSTFDEHFQHDTYDFYRKIAL